MRYAAALALLVAGSVGAQVRFDLVNRPVVERRLGAFAGDDQQRERTLKQMFVDAGCLPEHLMEQRVPGQKPPNVWCLLPGSSDQLVIVGAHFDRGERGLGVADNWSGASMLPSLLQGLRGLPRTKSYWFVGFVGEEDDLKGSQAFAAAMTAEQVSRTVAMVNLDTLGLGPAQVWESQSDPVQLAILARVAKASSVPLLAVNLDGIGLSDEESFIARKVCALVVHSLTPDTLHVLRSKADNLGAIQMDDYYTTYRLMEAYLATLDLIAIEPHTCKAKAIGMMRRSGLRIPNVITRRP